MMGLKRIHDVLSAVFGISISPGTIFSMTKNCAEKLFPTVEKIRTIVTALPVAHFDETGTRVDKKTAWFHNALINSTHLTVEEKRGKEGMDSSEVLPNFQGIAVHDCWKPYWCYPVTHSICCAHLLRELVGVFRTVVFYHKIAFGTAVLLLLRTLSLFNHKAGGKALFTSCL